MVRLIAKAGTLQLAVLRVVAVVHKQQPYVAQLSSAA
jgi:hypothetical protein